MELLDKRQTIAGSIFQARGGIMTTPLIVVLAYRNSPSLARHRVTMAAIIKIKAYFRIPISCSCSGPANYGHASLNALNPRRLCERSCRPPPTHRAVDLMETSFSEAERLSRGEGRLRRRAERRALDSLLASEDLVSMRKDGAPC